MMSDVEFQTILLHCTLISAMSLINCRRLQNLVITAPVLQCLKVKTCRPMSITIRNAPSLVSVIGSFKHRYEDVLDDYDLESTAQIKGKNDSERLIMMLEGMAQVKRLQLSIPIEFDTVKFILFCSMFFLLILFSSLFLPFFVLFSFSIFSSSSMRIRYMFQ